MRLQKTKICRLPCQGHWQVQPDSSLEVGCRIRPSARVVVLLEIGLERRGTSAVLRFVTEGSAGVEVEIVIIGSHLVLPLLHAPEHESNAAEEQGTAYTSHDASNNLLVAVA